MIDWSFPARMMKTDGKLGKSHFAVLDKTTSRLPKGEK
jgi:hypothetical protein